MCFQHDLDLTIPRPYLAQRERTEHTVRGLLVIASIWRCVYPVAVGLQVSTDFRRLSRKESICVNSGSPFRMVHQRPIVVHGKSKGNTCRAVHVMDFVE
jgi:hypothetical protein